MEAEGRGSVSGLMWCGIGAACATGQDNLSVKLISGSNRVRNNSGSESPLGIPMNLGQGTEHLLEKFGMGV